MLLNERYADRIAWGEDGSATLTLRKPIRAPDGEVGFLPLRRPTFGDIIAQSRQPGDDLDKIGWLLSRVSGVTAQAIDGIDAEDSMILAELIGSYFDRLPDPGRYRGDLLDRHAARITRTDDGATLVLRAPLTTHEGEATSLTLRRPTFKEMRTHRGAGDGNLATSAKLIALLSGVGPLTLDKIDALDGLLLGELVSGFLGNARATGAA